MEGTTTGMPAYLVLRRSLCFVSLFMLRSLGCVELITLSTSTRASHLKYPVGSLLNSLPDSVLTLPSYPRHECNLGKIDLYYW